MTCDLIQFCINFPLQIITLSITISNGAVPEGGDGAYATWSLCYI